MPDKRESGQTALVHGSRDLPKVIIDDYNVKLREGEGFAGDRASRRAFAHILKDWRERLRRLDADPLGDTPTTDVSKKKLDKIIANGEPEAAGLVQGVIEEFAQDLASVIRRFLRLKEWRDTGCFVIGGGLRDSRIGELAIGRAAILLKADGVEVGLVPVRHHPDEAGLIGAVHLAPSWMFAGYDGILAADIGGTNMRAGVVELALKKDPDLSKSKVWRSELWRHRDENPSRDQAVDRLIAMLRDLIKRAQRERLRLAPFIGIGVPGIIREDGTIERGGHNLPGNWQSTRFSLPRRIREGIERIDDHEVTVMMHNDAVLQGLSELCFVQEVKHWGVLTIGTGLGNARFTNKSAVEER